MDKKTIDIIEFLESFHKAVRIAGGDILIEHFRRMTIDEMIETLAPNGIRFCVKNKTNKI